MGRSQAELSADSCRPNDLNNLLGKLILLQDRHVIRLRDRQQLRTDYSSCQCKLLLVKPFQIFFGP